MAATLLLGLKDDSRVKMNASNTKITINQIMMAMCVDALQFIAWTKTKDAQHGRYKQKSILKALQGEYDKQNDDLVSFDTIEDFENYMKQFHQ